MSWETTGVAVAAPVLGFAVAYMGYRRSRHVDTVTEQSGAATESRAGVQQIIDAGNKLNDQLQRYLDQAQEDNQQEHVRYLDVRSQLEGCFARTQELTKELNRMYRKYGNDDTGETPVTGQ